MIFLLKTFNYNVKQCEIHALSIIHPVTVQDLTRDTHSAFNMSIKKFKDG